MKAFPFKKIDAFATLQSSGNPAGCVYLNSPDELSTSQMQGIAQELKGFVNEVGFICPIEPDRFQLQFYSSECRVDFCGHAIIGILYDLIQNSPELIKKESVTIFTDKGESMVENRISSNHSIFVTAPAQEIIQQSIDVQNLCQVLGIHLDDLLSEYTVQVINAGLNTLIVPMKALSTVFDMTPDFNGLKQFCIENHLDIITVFTPEVFSKQNKVRSRVFAPVFGYLEDPATGSGNSALGYYLYNQNLWDGDVISIEQNGFIEKYNVVKLLMKPDPKDQERVLFGGSALTRISGEYFIH